MCLKTTLSRHLSRLLTKLYPSCNIGSFWCRKNTRRHGNYGHAPQRKHASNCYKLKLLLMMVLASVCDGVGFLSRSVLLQICDLVLV